MAERALPANRPVSVQRSSSQTSRIAGRAGTRSRPGAGCKSARGHRTRPVHAACRPQPVRLGEVRSICNVIGDMSQRCSDITFSSWPGLSRPSRSRKHVNARLSEMPATSAGMTRRQVFRGAAQYGALTSAQILSPLRLRYSLRWPRRSSLAKRFALAFEPYSWVTLPPFLTIT